MTCAECKSPVLARGLCIKHYSRLQRRGLEPLPISHSQRCRNLARSEGEKRYFTGVPCSLGHLSERMVRSGRCIQCDREKIKQHNIDHPDLLKARKERYYTRRRNNIEVWAANVVGTTRARARKQGIKFDLTVADILAVVPKDRMCPALKIPLIWGGIGGRMTRNSPSIDRIKPSLGYVAGNIAIISHKANSIKQDALLSDELRKVADWMDAPLAYVKL